MNGPENMDQRVQDLLNGGIDGELSSDEQFELDSLLTGSGEIRDLNEELKVVVGLMDELPELEPPEYLQQTIERQVRLPVQGTDDKDKKKSIFAGWLPAHWPRTAFALAAGAVLTIGIYEMGSAPMTTEDATSLSGTMVKSQVAGQGALLDSVHIETDMLNGLVELRNKADLYTLDVQLNSEGPTQLVVNFADRGLEFEGVTRKQDRKDAVSISEGSVNVASSGEQRYTLNLRRIVEMQGQETTPLVLEFFAGELLVHEAKLQIPQQ